MFNKLTNGEKMMGIGIGTAAFIAGAAANGYGLAAEADNHTIKNYRASSKRNKLIGAMTLVTIVATIAAGTIHDVSIDHEIEETKKIIEDENGVYSAI